MWNDQDFGGIATQRDLISRLSKNSQTSFCKPLIEALKANCPSKLIIWMVQLKRSIKQNYKTEKDYNYQINISLQMEMDKGVDIF